MGDYKHSIAKVLPFEGYIINKKTGYVNDKSDSGGETIGGIARNFWPAWNGWPIIDKAKELHDFPNNLAGNIQLYSLLLCFYKVNFWDKIGGDLISSQTICDNLVDSSVNEGIKPAIKRAQEIVMLPQTGVITPDLVTKLNLLV